MMTVAHDTPITSLAPAHLPRIPVLNSSQNPFPSAAWTASPVAPVNENKKMAKKPMKFRIQFSLALVVRLWKNTLGKVVRVGLL